MERHRFITLLLIQTTSVFAYPILSEYVQSPPNILQLDKYLMSPVEDSKPIGRIGTVYSSHPSVHKFAHIEIVSEVVPHSMDIPEYDDVASLVDPIDDSSSAKVIVHASEEQSQPISSTSLLSSPTMSPVVVIGPPSPSPPPPPSPSFIPTYTSSFAAGVPTTTTTLQFGPGIVINSFTPTSASNSPTLIYTSTLNLAADAPSSTSSFGDSNVHSADANASEDHAPAIVGGFFLGLLVLSVLTGLLLNTKRIRNALFTRGIHSGLDSCVAKDLEKSVAPPSTADSSQPSTPSSLPTWMKLPSQIVPFHNHRDSLLSYFRLGRDSVTTQQSKPSSQRREKTVLDIVTDFPRSRFSDSSSEYCPSVHSVEPHEVEQAALPRRNVPLLTPEEFFSLPSSTTIASRHSRTSSTPVFGHKRREAGLSLATSRARSLKQKEKQLRQSKVKCRAKSMVVEPERGPERRRTQSVAVVGNGEWL